MVTGSSTTPSSSASAIARSPASGVRRSWDTHATNCRRLSSSRRSRSRASEAQTLARASRPPDQSATARLTAPAATSTTRRTSRSCSLMNIASATATTPATTASTVVASSTATCAVTERPRSLPSTRTPATPTTPDPASASKSTTTRSGTGVLHGFEPVAHAPDRDDAARMLRIVLDLLAQPPDVHGHCGLVSEAPSPHLLQELGAVECAARVAQEMCEQVELTDSQRERGTVSLGGARHQVETEVAVSQRSAVGIPGITPTGPPEHRVH